MPYTSSQKQKISQFVGFTSVKESAAAKCLKSNGWKLEQAVDDYFQNNQSSSSQSIVITIGKLFDQYRDEPTDDPDSIGIDGAMKYFEDIQVRLDEVVCLAVAELLQSPSLGEFTRQGFVNGWSSTGCETIQKQATYADLIRRRLPTDSELFRRVYRNTFRLCRMNGQRNVSIEIATEQWRLFFTADNGGVAWEKGSVPWLEYWIEFIETKHKRPINKDLWEQLEVLIRKTMEDETMAWWSPEGSWPGAIDDFVAFVKEKTRAGTGASGATEAMEVE